MSTYRGAPSSVVERLADLYGNNGKSTRSLAKPAKPRRVRRTKRSKKGYSMYASEDRSGPSKLIILVVVFAVLAAAGAVFAVTTKWISVVVTGVEDGQVVRGDQLKDLEVRIRTSGRAAGEVSVMLNGADILATKDDQGIVHAPLIDAQDGVNVVNYRVKATVPLVKDATGHIEFTVRFGPSLSVPAAVPPPTENRPAVIRGLVDDDVIVEVNGVAADREAGAFTARVAKGAREAVVIATAPNGDTTKAVVKFEDVVVKGDPIQAIHISAPMWRDQDLQDQITKLAHEGKINAIELTVKDEAGMVGYATDVPLAKQIGAIARDYDARQAIDHIHSLGLKAIGRVTCFLDPQLARWAYANGHRDMLIVDENGDPLDSYYGKTVFTNLGNDEVRQYNLDLALEAANLGFDQIMFDYVRRPEGELDHIKFPGLDVAPPVAIATFVKAAREELPKTTKLGLAVFGIAATRPIMIAQDVRLLAPLVDYISPMVYPSHWGAGEYKVPIPLAEPGKIVERAVRDFVRIASAGGAYVLPWLQDFSTGDYRYGEPEVRAQIDAAMRSGASGFLLWNPRVVYHFSALDPMPGFGAASDEDVAIQGEGDTTVPATTG